MQFGVPLTVTVPASLPQEPGTDDPNLLTWTATSDDNNRVRFLIPVEVYLPGTDTPVSPPENFGTYLESLADHGAVFSDPTNIMVDGMEATLVTAKSPVALNGVLGCATAGDEQVADCFGLQPDLALRIAVLNVDGTLLLVWGRTSGASPDTTFLDEFEDMLASIAFTKSASASALPSGADAGRYVAFGDSWPFGGHCNGCTPFPELYREGLAAAAGREVNMTNLTTNGGTAVDLLAEIKTAESTRAAIREADVVMIATGGNDLGPPFESAAAGSCGGTDGLDCFRSATQSRAASFDGMLTEIDGLREGRPTVVRVIANSNEFLADQGLIDLLGADFGKDEGVAITRMLGEVMCEVATKHAAKCVDLGAALNGPDLLTPRDVNTQNAMQDVADAIVATGFAELP